ncbi:GNAT family N-acetyltransferase [Kocuria atrinae]|uniref:GNAT family N-acetyltransferase n=1 Tax=Kocuria atrinae TaxID=592377 RepID=A0ABN2XJD2_9MICC
MTEQNNITVRDNPDHRRFELLDGDTVIGESHYTTHQGADRAERIFYHTVVDETYGGQGLAAVLTKQALGETVAEGLAIVPVCPYVKLWVRKHDDYASDVVTVKPEHLQTLAALGEQ